MFAFCSLSLFAIFLFSYAINSTQTNYGMKNNIFTLSEIEISQDIDKIKNENEFLDSNHYQTNHKITPDFIQKLEFLQSHSSLNKNYSNYQNINFNEQLTSKEMKNNHYQPFYLRNDWIINNPLKHEMIMNFINEFHLDEKYSNCRNKNCEESFKKNDESIICRNCCNHYKRTGKIRIIKKLKLKERKSFILGGDNQRNSNFLRKESLNCHDPKCGKPLPEDEEGDFCQFCFPLNERIKDSNERQRKINALIKEKSNISNAKIEILEKFSDILDLGNCSFECRNRYCRKSLDSSDGNFICQICCRYYKRKKKLRGNDKIIKRRKPISPKRNEKNINKRKRKEEGIKEKKLLKDQNVKFNKQKRSRIENNSKLIRENDKEIIKEISNLSRESIPIPISPLIQPFQKAKPSLNMNEFIENEENHFDSESFNYPKGDMIYHLNDYDANNVIKSEEISNDFLKPLDSIIEID